ncbi:ABC-2 type transport system ATP-binding protein [Bacilli bacterium PM5-3]|nr:ABC-2 type transport system ATP-binding protein [Bacilli bacterium PM5-3]MDH6603449.1 ABC-2 type transport system ATP-binding protein [Bacilli bacterium PM5-9]
MAIVNIKNLKKNFGKVEALKDVSFEIKSGEVFGFIGPNGAGKSTTIRILLGLLKADAGQAEIFGLDTWKDSVEIHNKISYVPGDVNLWPNLTGGEIIDVFLSLKNQKHNAKTDQLIEEFALDTSKKARSYSKGNRQKVALIAALSSDSDLYIFDEPTSGLDPLMEQVFQKHILKLKAEGKAILLSSHILSEVEKLCDKIAIIKNGTIIESGSLAQMRHLTRISLNVVTNKKVSDLKNLIGLHSVEQDDTILSVQVDLECLDGLLKHLNNYEIISLNSTPPTLEDLFMRYYETDKK